MNPFALLRSIIKTALCLILILTFLAIASLGGLVVHGEVPRRRLFSSLSHVFSGIILKVIGARIEFVNAPAEGKSYFFVGNHVGFIEILALASLRKSLFITSVEMQNTPGLGLLCEMGGSLFVERRSRANMQKEIGNIRNTLHQGFNVVLYPEGTSTNGEKMLPFKKSLMTAAAGTGVEIMPVVANFLEVNDEPMSWKWRDHLFWYGDHTFVAHIFRLTSLTGFHTKLEFLQPVVCHNENDRREVAAVVQKQIADKFIPVPLGPGEKNNFVVPEYLARR